jgi:hypothetical protein
MFIGKKKQIFVETMDTVKEQNPNKKNYVSVMPVSGLLDPWNVAIIQQQKCGIDLQNSV